MNRLLRTSFIALVAVGFLASLAGGAALLHLRAAQSKVEAARPFAPVPVASLVLEAARSYDVAERFVGRLEPAQQARIAFERSGLVTAVAVEEGEVVSADAVIATLDTAILEVERDRLLGQRKQVTASLELARLTEGRQRVLRDRGHASEQRLDEARLGAVALEGELAALDAAIRRIDVDLDKSVVRAPFGGRIGARFIDTGSVVDAGTPVVDILETGRPQARIGLSPEAAAALTPGEVVGLSANGRNLQARVVAIRPDLTTATRTVSVLFDVRGEPAAKFGDTVELRLSRPVVAEGFWLPISALSEGERGLWSVLTLQPDDNGTFRIGQETVELLHTAGDRVFVRGTLRAGDRVVANGRNRVVPGQQVSLAAGEG
ncbi:efflux RND transporter periplasmic adaptor subunit [Pelagibius sp.]|uniref:efflux RND transporter periplasmic adaptor subunit n=1 Tax=Pelagibius sp. TaxID=1931238 RepID=UPI003B50834C